MSGHHPSRRERGQPEKYRLSSSCFFMGTPYCITSAVLTTATQRTLSFEPPSTLILNALLVLSAVTVTPQLESSSEITLDMLPGSRVTLLLTFSITPWRR